MDVAVLSEKIIEQIKPVLSKKDEEIIESIGTDTWKKFTSVFRTEREKKVLQALRRDTTDMKLTGKAELIVEHIIYMDLKTRSVLSDWVQQQKAVD